MVKIVVFHFSDGSYIKTLAYGDTAKLRMIDAESVLNEFQRLEVVSVIERDPLPSEL